LRREQWRCVCGYHTFVGSLMGGEFNLVPELNYLRKFSRKSSRFSIFLKSIAPAEIEALYYSRQISFFKWRVANVLTGF
jgi:hypothetical protein